MHNQDVTQHSAELQSALRRIACLGVPSAGSEVAQEVVLALAQGQNLWASDADAVAGLSHEAQALYTSAVGRGIKALIHVTEEVIERVVSNPARYKDLCVTTATKRKRDSDIYIRRVVYAGSDAWRNCE